MAKKLRVYIAGVPTGINVGIFDTREAKGSPNRVIITQPANSDWVVDTRIDAQYGGVPVKVVIRGVGFKFYEYPTTIELGIGLFHAANLEVDRVYNGANSKVLSGWDSAIQHRKAEEKILEYHRQFRKDNSQARTIKYVLDIGSPIVGGLIGLAWFPVGSIIGVIAGLGIGYCSSKITIKALGLD